MKKNDLPLLAQRYAKKRGILESVIGQTKTVCNIEHTRHRKAANAFVNVYAALAAYSFYERKPAAHVNIADRLLQQGEPTWQIAA